MDVRSALDTLVRALGQTATRTFGEALTLLLTERSATWKPRSRELYTRHAEALRVLWGDLPLDDLRRSHAVEMMSQAGNRTAARHRLVVAKSVWLCAQRNELTSKPMPWAGLKPPTFDARDRVLSESELGRLWHALESFEGRACPGCLKAIRILIMTGLRVSEVCEMRESDIDYDARVFRLRDSKTGKRVVAVGARVLAMLKAAPRTTWLCQRRDGRPVTRTMVGLLMNRLCREAQIHGASTHTLRHTFVTQAIAAGVPMEHVRELVGHSTQWMTSRYSHLTEKHVQHAADTISERLSRSRK